MIDLLSFTYLTDNADNSCQGQYKAVSASGTDGDMRFADFFFRRKLETSIHIKQPHSFVLEIVAGLTSWLNGGLCTPQLSHQLDVRPRDPLTFLQPGLSVFQLLLDLAVLINHHLDFLHTVSPLPDSLAPSIHQGVQTPPPPGSSLSLPL